MERKDLMFREVRTLVLSDLAVLVLVDVVSKVNLGRGQSVSNEWVALR